MLIADENRTTTIQSFIFLTLTALAMAVVMHNATPYMAAATGTFMLLTYGVMVRKQNAKLHATLMSSAVALDIGLVLVLELQRNAVKTAVASQISMGQYLHIGFSLLAVILYIPAMILGIYLLKGKGNRAQLLSWHKPIAITAYILRVLGFITMFTMLELVKRH